MRDDHMDFHREAPLETLLFDPLCLAVMQRDGLSPHEVLRDMRKIAARLRCNTPLNGACAA